MNSAAVLREEERQLSNEWRRFIGQQRILQPLFIILNVTPLPLNNIELKCNTNCTGSMSALEAYTLQLTIHVAVYLCLQVHMYITVSACGMRAYVCLCFGLDIFVCLRLCVFQHLLMCSSVCLCVRPLCVWYFTVFGACLNFVHFLNYLLKAMSLPDPFFLHVPPFVFSLSFRPPLSPPQPLTISFCCFCL